MNTKTLLVGASLAVALLVLAPVSLGFEKTDFGGGHVAGARSATEEAMQVHYLEIVTPDVEQTCRVIAETHGVVFGDPVASLGNARTAELTTGGRIGVRAPMRDSEAPVVRPYMLVDDIQAAIERAESAGATIALPPMELPGEGTCAIYVLGGIDHGLWQR